jgi:hypothetical protein
MRNDWLRVTIGSRRRIRNLLLRIDSETGSSPPPSTTQKSYEITAAARGARRLVGGRPRRRSAASRRAHAQGAHGHRARAEAHSRRAHRQRTALLTLLQLRRRDGRTSRPATARASWPSPSSPTPSSSAPKPISGGSTCASPDSSKPRHPITRSTSSAVDCPLIAGWGPRRAWAPARQTPLCVLATAGNLLLSRGRHALQPFSRRSSRPRPPSRVRNPLRAIMVSRAGGLRS